MRLGADFGNAALSVVLDLRHPFAYLALAPARELAASLGSDIDWLPMRASTLNPASSPTAADDRGVRHRRHRATAVAREIEVYAAAQALVLRDYYRDGDARAANLGWLWMRARHVAQLLPYLNDVFRAYWSLELDASSLEDVSEVVDSRGGGGSTFRSWAEVEGPAALDALASELEDFGLYQVPAYVVGDEVFYGRQHLPMIRWILEGRVGQGPI